MISQQTEPHGYVYTSHFDLKPTLDLYYNVHPGLHAQCPSPTRVHVDAHSSIGREYPASCKVLWT